MKINYFNSDHVHALIDLPTSKCVEEVVQLLKGNSPHWIKENRLLRGRFAWGRGYGAFSSQSDVSRVAAYIANQESHHRKKSFWDEYQLFVKKSVWSGAMIETARKMKTKQLKLFPVLDRQLGT